MTSDTVSHLRDCLEQLVGLSCWESIFANQEVLQLEIGEKRPIASVAGISTTGAWALLVEEADWVIRDSGGDAIANSSSPLAQVDDGLALLRNRIVGISLEDNLRLEVSFEAGARLDVDPSAVSVDSNGWELFAPDHVLFAIGGGGTLTERRSDQ